ncbi:AraC family transcriptional regulator [Clostridium sp. BL-8]|uniref:AraC family transcriptional regulator n=1 Tax=Clostridium sp. BL-8 TaxID=349938 RepID=UPI0009C998D1|nr:AraC family transcriptional regulator [Clostridium sp. BL-8]OOM73885.1 HTH-type transcriptional regulator CdhR [Clostridium sp. BL-8]
MKISKQMLKATNILTPGQPLLNNQELLTRLISLANTITTAEGNTKTVIPYLSICRHTYESPLIPSVLSPAFCLILQGEKELHLGEHIAHYYEGDYLASIIDMPASGKVVGATREFPYIGLRVDFTAEEVASVVAEAEIELPSRNKKPSTAAFIGKSDIGLLELFLRVLILANTPYPDPFLSTLMMREMIYRLVSGKYGHLFLQQSLYDKQSDGIGKAIGWIKENFSNPFTTLQLAKISNMSVSSLQHKFKEVTTMGPLQYQKQLRLQEARRLMLTSSIDVTTAALEVGYESPSQFNREYKRLFGLSPLKDIREIQNNPYNISESEV